MHEIFGKISSHVIAISFSKESSIDGELAKAAIICLVHFIASNRCTRKTIGKNGIPTAKVRSNFRGSKIPLPLVLVLPLSTEYQLAIKGHQGLLSKHPW